MKKRFVAAIVSLLLITLSSIVAYAEPKQMPDGGIFDAAYYAENNPDVVAALGTDENVLYQHYLNCGKAEGRLPYASATTEAATDTQNISPEEIELAAWAYKMVVAREARNLNSGYLAISRFYVVDINDKDCKSFYRTWGETNCFIDSPHVCMDYQFINDNGATILGTVMVGRSTIRSLNYDQVVASDGSYISYIYTTNGASSTWRYTNVTLIDANAVVLKAAELSSSTIYTTVKTRHQGLYAGSISQL